MDVFDIRLTPATNEEIIALAESLQADPILYSVFERCGYDGDTTVEEEAAVDAAINAYRRGPLGDRDPLHLALAPCLVRRRVGGIISSLDSTAALEFLEHRKVERAGQLVKTAPTTAKEVIDLARDLREDPQIWAMYMRIKEKYAATNKESKKFDEFQRRRTKKFGLYNQCGAALSTVTPLLRAVASGRISSIDSEEAWALVRTSHQVTN